MRGCRTTGSERGRGFVEAVIATPLFLILVFASIQFMVLAWRFLSMQFVITQVARDLAQRHCEGTGGTAAVCDTASPRIAYAKNRIVTLSSRFSVGLTTSNSSVCITSDGSDSELGCNSPGNPGDLVTLRVEYNSPIIGPAQLNILGFGNGFSPTVKLTGSAISRVERTRD